MQVIAIKTPTITASKQTIFDVIDAAVAELKNGDILVITSKVVSLCEGSVVSLQAATKEELIKQESDMYLDGSFSQYGHRFAIVHNSLVGGAGIDESNADGGYVLWPKDPWKSAIQIWQHLKDRFGLKHVGVIISDSTSTPLRLGASGISIAHCGFMCLNDYIGQKDLFGRDFVFSRANIAGGLAAAAVVVMGEGAESTPLAVIRDASFVQFCDTPPDQDERSLAAVDPKDDLFYPFLHPAPWKKGDKSSGT
jgi:dihydrofolate synthase / folylpolyglutamate synthase